MYLLLSIVLSTLLGYVLLMAGPLFGGLLAFGIIAGCLFRGLYLLTNIHNRLSATFPKKDRAKEVNKLI
ncbi:hypothetical protein [Mesobacillus harenae]|uniref:hypothetical protein n=1 Tax=Mesobacillus harenae TaxID=2213203 RepID=UPI0015810A2C|nr:hypothetical protein [Mesobacillus harenae]